MFADSLSEDTLPEDGVSARRLAGMLSGPVLLLLHSPEALSLCLRQRTWRRIVIVLPRVGTGLYCGIRFSRGPGPE